MDEPRRPEREPRLRRPWSRSERRIPRTVLQPIQQFMHREASGGIVLAAASLLALLWANIDHGSYDLTWHAPVSIRVGPIVFEETLRHVINDGLMALFFFVIGLEVKRELLTGELSDRRAATLPLFAAVGGMVVPALLFVLLTRGTPVAGGWGIPMATDIAFALGVLALLGSRIPMQLKVLLLGIAVIDDIGAILVIALFYGAGVELPWLLASLAGLLAIAAMTRMEVRATTAYVAAGVFVWFTMFESGVHATIAGVLLGFSVSSRSFQHSDAVSGVAREVADKTDGSDPDAEADAWRQLSWLSREAVSPLLRAERSMHPWTSYLVLPLFALANVGVLVDMESARDAATSITGLAIGAGLVIGKPVGILLGAALAVRLGIASLPAGVSWRHIAGIGALAGIGFTVSLFITTLAFDDAALVAEATLAVLGASILAGLVGAALLLSAPTRR